MLLMERRLLMFDFSCISGVILQVGFANGGVGCVRRPYLYLMKVVERLLPIDPRLK